MIGFAWAMSDKGTGQLNDPEYKTTDGTEVPLRMVAFQFCILELV